MALEDMLAVVAADRTEEGLARQVDFDRLPQHVAVIMDGNGRWAAQRHLPRVEGHRAGIESVREVVEGSARLGIGVLTLYAFSVENWKRPRLRSLDPDDAAQAVSAARAEHAAPKQHPASSVIGRVRELAPRTCAAELAPTEEKTAANTRDAVQHRAQLRRARRDRRRRAPDRGPGVSADGSTRAVRRVSLHRRPARSRPAHPHQRRDARQQFSAVADRLRRDLGHRDAVAGLPQARTCSRPSSRTRSATAGYGGINHPVVAGR